MIRNLNVKNEKWRVKKLDSDGSFRLGVEVQQNTMNYSIG